MTAAIRASGTPNGRCHGLPAAPRTRSATSSTPTTTVDRHEHPALGVRVVIVVMIVIVVRENGRGREGPETGAPRPISSGRYSRCTGWPSP